MHTSNTTKTALVFGATSSLGVVLCRMLAKRGWRLVLSGRDAQELVLLAGDIHVRYGIAASAVPCDLMQGTTAIEVLGEHATNVNSLWMLAGDMGGSDPHDSENISLTTWLNYTAPAMLLAHFARHFERRGNGNIVVVSSVAGDRGRQSNYVYGSAKAALTSFASGLRNRLHKKGVHVMTVKPGFMDTPMTYGMHSPLIATREAAAGAMIRALEKKCDEVYVPWFWEWIMRIICHIPERIFKKLSL